MLGFAPVVAAAGDTGLGLGLRPGADFGLTDEAEVGAVWAVAEAEECGEIAAETGATGLKASRPPSAVVLRGPAATGDFAATTGVDNIFTATSSMRTRFSSDSVDVDTAGSAEALDVGVAAVPTGAARAGGRDDAPLAGDGEGGAAADFDPGAAAAAAAEAGRAEANGELGKPGVPTKVRGAGDMREAGGCTAAWTTAESRAGLPAGRNGGITRMTGGS